MGTPALACLALACSDARSGGDDEAGTAVTSFSTEDDDGSTGEDGSGTAGVLDMGPGTTSGGGDGGSTDPQTCAAAALNKTYVGCEFWPTVTYNPVYSNFDFAAVVANASGTEAEITVEREGEVLAMATVPPGGLETIALPWIAELKGPDFAADTTGPRPSESARVDGGAYRLSASVPVTVWQFNPLQYEDDVADCSVVQDIGLGSSCLSVSNDAALLIPSAAMTENYRVFTQASTRGTVGGYDDVPSSVAITATEDGTTVTVQLNDGAQVIAGPGVSAIPMGGVAEFAMDAGDVVQLLGQPGMWWGDAHSDLSGSLVTADKPIQVIGVVGLTTVPSPEVAGQGYADHLEETILPAEVLGAHYVIAPPTSAKGENIGHFVRFYGNFDGTALTYVGDKPAGAPDSLESGQVVQFETNASFEVTGSESFAIGMFGRGGQVHTPSEVPTSGDPAFSLAVAVPQFRSKYIFLAPVDYISSYADIIMPAGTVAGLDGGPLTAPEEPIPGTNWVVVREPLGPGNDGAHVLETQAAEGSDPAEVGVQVMGYGHATAYMYPGGLNLEVISEVPQIP
ncbi:bacterial Ig-like domain protein [Plesiocystis pacifica SIR-1]|uniref:Bacterial Ig-like domain protein n=1 Tax=Plesiocystis pacifica SIR-1 TaxID=391625 RepID=A6FX33_9BACT|nr:IgGFc-binding protein [Plesiocystis pacifica]EDM81857.1 bacterial Ig-like domain protein [Plesiocystis pacifica SIR-1]